MTELTATVVIESLLRATADDATPIIRRLARNQARVFLDSRAGDAGEAERLRKALERARSDLHLVTLHGSVRPMWEEAKAARDRVHEALAATPMRDSLEPTTDDVRRAIHRLTVLAQKESDPPAITKAMIWAYLHGRTDVATPAPAVDAECPSSPDGKHQVDCTMESGPNNCFHCEAPMGGRDAR